MKQEAPKGLGCISLLAGVSVSLSLPLAVSFSSSFMSLFAVLVVFSLPLSQALCWASSSSSSRPQWVLQQSPLSLSLFLSLKKDPSQTQGGPQGPLLSVELLLAWVPPSWAVINSGARRRIRWGAPKRREGKEQKRIEI